MNNYSQFSQTPPPPPPTPEQLDAMSNYSYAPGQVEQIRRSNKLKLRWGLICLIAPTALIFVSIILYAVTNFAFASMTSDSNAGQATINVLMFLVGAISVLTWLPGIIVGIILLATRKALPPAQ